MMSRDATYSVFLRDILSDPADFTPRLILADWLDDNDLEPERVKLLRTPRVPFTTQRREDGRALARTIDLRHQGPPASWFTLAYKDLQGQWLSDVAGQAVWSGAASVGYGIKHGFVSEVCAPQRWWLKHGPALVQRHPVADVVLQHCHCDDAIRFSTSDCVERGWVLKTRINWNGVEKRLFAALSGGVRDSRRLWGIDFQHCDYANATQAVAALSQACVNWARQEAGMPPLPRSPLAAHADLQFSSVHPLPA